MCQVGQWVLGHCSHKRKAVINLSLTWTDYRLHGAVQVCIRPSVSCKRGNGRSRGQSTKQAVPMALMGT